MAIDPLRTANANWGHAQILNAQGNPARPIVPPQPPANTGGGGGSSGSDPMIDIADLKRNVDWLNKGLATTFILGLGALVGLFFILDDRIADRFDRLDAPLGEIQSDLAGQSATLTAIDRRLDRIEENDGPESEKSD